MYYDVFEKLCESNNVRPSDVSKGTGIATSTLTSWKKGRYTPKADKLQKIADFFNVSVECFYSNEVSKTGHDKEYYFDEETAGLAQEIFENKELRLLINEARDASPKDIKLAHDMLMALKRRERND